MEQAVQLKSSLRFEDIFYKCILWIIENQGLGKSCQFRDLLLEFKEGIDQYSFVKYEHDTNDIESINSDRRQLETKLRDKFESIKSFIQEFENSSDLITDIEQYQQLTQKFSQIQTRRQNGILYTNLHVEWVIRINAINHNVQDRLKLFKTNVDKFNYGKYDIIISNPPYINKFYLKYLEKDVIGFEPNLALEGGIDGFTIIERVIKKSSRLLKVGGKLILEIGFDQKLRVIKLLKKEKYFVNKIIKDYGNKDRCIICTKL